MAGTLTYQVQLRISNGGMSDTFSSTILTDTQTGVGLYSNVLQVGTVNHLPLHLSYTAKWVLIKNLDDVNFIYIGTEGTSGTATILIPILKLKAGEHCLFSFAASEAPSVIMVRADSGWVSVFYTMFHE